METRISPNEQSKEKVFYSANVVDFQFESPSDELKSPRM